ncbi:MAG: hypothetical protein M3170_05180 [Candidatus Dormibacteraeota bacterium]|jgi:hypothetical protein|nr:hypothetical protein [Candidatus Dormibacteraeota bacterium]MDQ6920973.1 hypothetical protein [Candidatus Dormibacteraeota bacterium]
MPWGELALNTVALLVYPGLLACLLLGLAAEMLAARALGGGPGSIRLLWPRLRQRDLPPLPAGAGLLTLLAAAQLALPFSPLPPTERNLLVAAIALLSASWLAWSRGWDSLRRLVDARLVLVAQACWLVALLAPALVAQSLRPQVLGAAVLVGQLPLKLLAAALFLICLPMLLHLLPEAGGDTEGTAFGVVRMLLWLPLCGLFASVFVPPAADAALNLVEFAVATVGAAATAILLAMGLTRWRLLPARLLYVRVAMPLALAALILAALADLYPQGL